MREYLRIAFEQIRLIKQFILVKKISTLIFVENVVTYNIEIELECSYQRCKRSDFVLQILTRFYIAISSSTSTQLVFRK